jgi:AcrR family transcriptional regulator
MDVVAERGFDATVEEIAQRAGVSPRTVFRHYRTQDRLIAAAVTDMFEACRLPAPGVDFENWVKGVPLPEDDLDAVIEFVALTFHTRSAEIIGEAIWDLHAPRAEKSSALAELDELRHDVRLRGIDFLVHVVWQMAGGEGEPPRDLVLAFALNLSAFTTRALMIDFDQTTVQVGELTADILKGLLRRAVEAQGSQHDHSVDG